MLGGIPFVRVLGMAAGALILFVGIFVLRAKPESRLHQLFFALALADGVSGIAYNVGISTPLSEWVRLQAVLVYYYSFIAFLALLVAFGLVFPKPVLRGRAHHALVAAVAVVAGLAILALAIDYAFYFSPVRSASGVTVSLAPGGRWLITAFLLATAFIIVRTTRLVKDEPSPSHRLQGALVLGGMALGYAPFATTTLVVAFQSGSSSTFFGRWDVALSYWAALLTTLCVVGSALTVAIDARPDRARERRVLLACFAGVLVLAAVAIPANARAAADWLQVLGVLAYPVLLGYAIARYEVLDIDAHVRRAATASMIGAGFTAAFLLFEVFLEQVLQGILSVGVSATLVAGIAAALLTAIVSVPLARALRKAAGRIAPALHHDDVTVRKREIYRHALHGAAMDGVIAPHELRVLQRLRESLQISEADHASMMREVGVAV